MKTNRGRAQSPSGSEKWGEAPGAGLTSASAPRKRPEALERPVWPGGARLRAWAPGRRQISRTSGACSAGALWDGGWWAPSSLAPFASTSQWASRFHSKLLLLLLSRQKATHRSPSALLPRVSTSPRGTLHSPCTLVLASGVPVFAAVTQGIPLNLQALVALGGLHSWVPQDYNNQRSSACLEGYQPEGLQTAD